MEETMVQGNPELETKKENRAMGLLGAVLGGILGGASIVLLGQLGYVAALSGVILAFCTLKGYDLLGKGMSKQGILICILVMLLTPYLADRVSWAIVIVRDLGLAFGDAFKYVHEIVAEYAMEEEYWKDLLMVYGFTVLGGFAVVRQALKK